MYHIFDLKFEQQKYSHRLDLLAYVRFHLIIK